MTTQHAFKKKEVWAKARAMLCTSRKPLQACNNDSRSVDPTVLISANPHLGYCRSMVVQYGRLLKIWRTLYINVKAYYWQRKTQQGLNLTKHIHIYLFYSISCQQVPVNVANCTFKMTIRLWEAPKKKHLKWKWLRCALQCWQLYEKRVMFQHYRNAKEFI